MKSKFNPYRTITLIAIMFFSLQSISFAHFGSKGPYGGSVTCIITQDTNAVYIGTAEGGVFESTNNALVAWRARPVGLKTGQITALAHTGSYLFTATADSGIYIFNGYVGSDRYWVKVNNGLTNLQVTSLVVIDSITLLAGTNGGGIFKTTNKGATWTSANTNITNMNIRKLVKAGTRIIHTSAAGVWASDDNGATWFDFNDANTSATDIVAAAYNDTTDELLVANVTGTLYLATSASTTLTPAYTDITTGIPSTTLINSIATEGYGWYLATDHGAYLSSATNINWISKNNGLTTLAVTAFAPFRANMVCGTTGEGIFQTAAGSPGWTQNNNGFNNLKTWSIATSGETVIVAATEKGVFVSKNLASSYIAANTGLTDSLHVHDLTFMETKLFAATDSGIFISNDTGTTWTAFNSGLGTGLQMKQVVASANYIYTYSSAGEVYYSDGTAAWTAAQTGLPTGVEPTSVAFWSNNVILGTVAHGVYTSTQGSASWTAANTGLTNMHVTSVTALEGKLYAGTHGNGVFVTNASTINWAATAALSIPHTVTMQLDGSHIQALATYGGYVFASYRGGLLVTDDAGATWEEGGNQFNLPSYTAVNKIAFVTTRVFVTTEQNSLYSNSLSELPLNSTISSSTDATCHGTCNGIATITATGGVAPYTYSWSNGAITETVNNLCAQTYTVTVTDGNNVTSTKTVTIAQPVAILANTSATASTNGTDGTASSAPTNGVAPYTYSWSNGGTTATITGIGAATYTVTVTDSKGCSVIDTATVTGVVGIKEVKNSTAHFSFYPNPAHTTITVDLTSVKAPVKSIAIYDVTGKLMQSVSDNALQSKVQLSVAYPAGVYYIQLTTDSGVATKKLIIQ